jgi:hypothetical protein
MVYPVWFKLAANGRKSDRGGRAKLLMMPRGEPQELIVSPPSRAAPSRIKYPIIP